MKAVCRLRILTFTFIKCTDPLLLLSQWHYIKKVKFLLPFSLNVDVVFTVALVTTASRCATVWLWLSTHGSQSFWLFVELPNRNRNKTRQHAAKKRLQLYKSKMKTKKKSTVSNERLKSCNSCDELLSQSLEIEISCQSLQLDQVTPCSLGFFLAYFGFHDLDLTILLITFRIHHLNHHTPSSHLCQPSVFTLHVTLLLSIRWDIHSSCSIVSSDYCFACLLIFSCGTRCHWVTYHSTTIHVCPHPSCPLTLCWILPLWFR